MNCVVNILSSLADKSSGDVDAHNRAQLNQPAFHLIDCFYFLCFLKSHGPSTDMYSSMRTSFMRNKGIVNIQ